ncbi:hypothetical protein Ciccas_006126 [Cichlidogyrus casuarinus]|uniref:Uncharacterized protein n=1 Tax=Cichlidogyrus casuarinus TaxID=1844966 RepID=A0ABD2QAH3_9PLAT
MNLLTTFCLVLCLAAFVNCNERQLEQSLEKLRTSLFNFFQSSDKAITPISQKLHKENAEQEKIYLKKISDQINQFIKKLQEM